MARTDPHSYADDTQPRTKSFDWKARVDFAERVITAEVALHFVEPARVGGTLDLDTRALQIEAVTLPDGSALDHKLHDAEPILGSRLAIAIPAGTRTIHIRYRTSPTASALQWLTPEQTLGKKHPFLFSQCQAIHARSVLPCQDTPSFRQTFTASIEVDGELRAVMAAASLGREGAVERFAMPQPIPPYLFAFAVGDLASKDLSSRSRVWGEPAQLEAAAWEFAYVEDHLIAAEKLFGPYDWDRFDLLVMPPAFPYGGMENPRLTFLTPSLLTGDRSLVNVVAHELAHSWTGNLVTNANAEHFWLNEGFTVFAERRILEALEGESLALLHAAIGFEKLLQAFEQNKEHPELTKLRTHLTNVDPDEAFSVVPYEKGYLFLKTLEAAAGRAAFDQLLTTWLETHRFGVATTEDFIALIERMNPELLQKVDHKAWLDGINLPSKYWKPESKRLATVQSIGARVPTIEESSSWSPAEWQLYLESMQTPPSVDLCKDLDAQYHLTESKNPEVLVSWLILACAAGYDAVLARVEQVLGETGRMKYLKPLYRALTGRAETKERARKWFTKYRDSYHPIAQQVISGVLK
jgi:leukotriene-A4 hydrolase